MKDAEKVNLWLDKTTKRKLVVLAADDRRSLTTFVETLIEDAYKRKFNGTALTQQAPRTARGRKPKQNP